MKPTFGLILAITVIQVICASVFLWDIGSSILGLPTPVLSWQMREAIEIAAATGLILGSALGLRLAITAYRQAQRSEASLRVARGAVAEVIEEQFAAWQLTPAEREIAWLTVKGLSYAEIASVLNRSEGTIKSLSNAIFKKAGVSGRTQLIASFIEELFE